MVGVRYIFPSGTIVEFTHHAGCIQPPEAWVEAHRREAKTAKLETFESEKPVNRRYDSDKDRWINGF